MHSSYLGSLIESTYWLLSGRGYSALLSTFEATPEHPDAGMWAASCDVLEALGGAAR